MTLKVPFFFFLGVGVVCEIENQRVCENVLLYFCEELAATFSCLVIFSRRKKKKGVAVGKNEILGFGLGVILKSVLWDYPFLVFY